MALLSLLKSLPCELNATFFFTLLLSLICFISTLFVFKLRGISKSKLNLPPSPPKLPIVGNLHQIGTLPHRSFQILSQKYGSLMFLQLGKIPTLVVSSAEMASEILKNHDISFADRPQGLAPKIFFYGCTDFGFAPYGENRRLKRKVCAHEFLSLKRVQSYQYIREEEVAEMVNKIRDVSLSNASSVNLTELLIATLTNIVCKCVIGQKYDTDGNSSKNGQLARKVMIQLAAFSVGDYFPSLGWVDVVTGLVQGLKATFGILDELFDQVIEEHKRMKKGDNCFSNRTDFVDILLKLQEGGKLTQVDLKGLLMDMFVGGIETGSTTLEWAMVELVRNPMQMKKVQEEVRRVVGHKSKVDEYDINQMNYLKCVVKETLRLHPPAPLLAGRVARSSVKLSGYTIPEKTMVYVNAWAIQRDPEFWERPEEFLAERFENNEFDFKGLNFHYIPFGSGRRGCPGITFGTASVEFVLANLLHWFDWKLPGNGISVQDIDMSETFGLTVSKKLPLHLQTVPYVFR